MPNSSSAHASRPHPSGPGITLVGPGALGCLMAGYLERAGVRCALLDHRPERARRLQEGGIVVETETQTWTSFPLVTAEPERLGPQQWILVLVKAYHNEGLLSRLPPLIGPKTLLISLQNGIGYAPVFGRLLPPERIALGVTANGATLIAEGRVRHAGLGPTTLGLATPTPEMEAGLALLAGQLTRAGWPASVVHDVQPHLWRKLIVNAGVNPLSALSGLANGRLLENPETRHLQERLVTEAWEVCRACGVDIGLDRTQALELVREVCRKTARNMSSMLQDRLKKRPTEIEYISGAVVRAGERCGVPAPVNDTLTRLVRLLSGLGWGEPCGPGGPGE